MSRTPSDKPQRPTTGLRLVRQEPAERVAAAVEAGAGESGAPRPKSRLGQLMTAWADAIDRDVALILDR